MSENILTRCDTGPGHWTKAGGYECDELKNEPTGSIVSRLDESPAVSLQTRSFGNPRKRGCLVHPTLSHGVLHNLTPAAEAQFFPDADLVSFDGLDADAEFGGDFLVAVAPSQLD